jgi:hypothetical protein
VFHYCRMIVNGYLDHFAKGFAYLWLITFQTMYLGRNKMETLLVLTAPPGYVLGNLVLALHSSWHFHILKLH